MKTLNGIVFLETKEIRKSLNIGNQTCLELFQKKDFSARKIGKSWLVMKKFIKCICKKISYPSYDFLYVNIL